MPPGSNPVPAGSRTVSADDLDRGRSRRERARVLDRASGPSSSKDRSYPACTSAPSTVGSKRPPVIRHAATARSTSSRVSGETTTGEPACRVSALTSLRPSNRLQRRSRSAMRCSASSASDAGPPTMITWASLPIARNRRSAGMGRGVRLGRRPRPATAAAVVERLDVESSSDAYGESRSSAGCRSRGRGRRRGRADRGRRLGRRGHAAGQGEQAGDAERTGELAGATGRVRPPLAGSGRAMDSSVIGLLVGTRIDVR